MMANTRSPTQEASPTYGLCLLYATTEGRDVTFKGVADIARSLHISLLHQTGRAML